MSTRSATGMVNNNMGEYMCVSTEMMSSPMKDADAVWCVHWGIRAAIY